MNDNELDDLLSTWETPLVSPVLRERVRTGFSVVRKRRAISFFSWRWIAIHRKSLSAGAALAMVVLLFMVPRALPQPTVPVPWTVDSEFLRYADDGSSFVEMYSTSYNLNEMETIVSRSSPGNPLKTAMWQAADAAAPLHQRLMLPLVVGPDGMERFRKAREASAARTVGIVTGCGFLCLALEHHYFPRAAPGVATGCIAGEIVGRATILNHPTAAFRERWTEHGRMTLWMAPDLGCFALRITSETERPDGTFQLASEKRALKITALQ